MVLSLGNTSFAIRPQCCKTKTIQRNKTFVYGQEKVGCPIFISIGVQFVLKQSETTHTNNRTASNKVNLITGTTNDLCNTSREYIMIYSDGLFF